MHKKFHLNYIRLKRLEIDGKVDKLKKNPYRPFAIQICQRCTFDPKKEIPYWFSLSYFILAVPIRKCFGKHSCMSFSFPIVTLNDSSFFPDSVTTSAQ